MYKGTQRWVTTWESSGIPGKCTLCGSVWQSPSAIDGHIVIAAGLQAEIDQSLCVRVNDGFIGGARIMIVGVPPAYWLAQTHSHVYIYIND